MRRSYAASVQSKNKPVQLQRTSFTSSVSTPSPLCTLISCKSQKRKITNHIDRYDEAHEIDRSTQTRERYAQECIWSEM